jgi:hypothetical protein
MDGELDPSQAETVGKHIKSCAECAAFYQDLRSIREGVERLELFDPPEHVWTSLRLQLSDEGLIRSKPRGAFWAAFLPKHFPYLKPAWSGAILALFLGAGSLLVYDLTTRSPVVPDPMVATSHQEDLTEELRKAEANYRAAIEALSASSRKKLEGLDPVLAGVSRQLGNHGLLPERVQTSCGKQPAKPAGPPLPFGRLPKESRVDADDPDFGFFVITSG